MKNKIIVIFLIVVTLIIIGVVVFDFSSSRPDKRKGNPYEYSVDEYKSVNKNLVKYKEIKQIKINAEKPHALSYSDNKIYCLADNYLQVLNLSGKQLLKKTFNDIPRCVTQMGKDKIVVGFKNYISIITKNGKIVQTSAPETGKSIFTSVDFNEPTIYIADAGERKVLLYNLKAEKIGEFEGESGASVLHGFIIPSPYFDLAVNKKNELWVVNPGMHALQNYLDDGSLMDFWEKSSIEIDGFSGCCNPAHFTFLPNGNFVTSEKGLVRIKEYSPTGELISVVAPPEKFEENGQAPDLTSDENGTILALDFDKKVIRFFEPK